VNFFEAFPTAAPPDQLCLARQEESRPMKDPFETRRLPWAPLVSLLAAACSGSSSPAPDAGAAAPAIVEGACETAGADAGADPDSLRRIGCKADFEALASQPLDTSLPGARSVKVVLDQMDGDALYFQNSKKFRIHYDFASTHLSGGAHPAVASLAEFNQKEYFAPDRRFVLGAVTYYQGPGVWALEVAPYDTASVAMIEKLYAAVARAAYFGPALAFHPTSDVIQGKAKGLPATVRVKSTDDLYKAIDYQPLNLATAIGHLRFVNAAALDTTYLSFRDIVVLDHVPNDISVVLGLVTEEFQTPLSHVNVLSQNRHTPNMGLRHATTNAKLRALDGKWVKLRVGANDWDATEATAAEADAFWTQIKPPGIQLQAVDLTVKDLRDLKAVTVEGTGPLRDAIKAAIPAFGGKAAHLSVLANTPDVPVPPAFVIPAGYYVQFMQQNGLFDQVDKLLADPDFRDKPEVRDQKLADLRKAIQAAPVDDGLQVMLKAKLAADFPGQIMRFRTSTNSEDLDGFPCAGCYESHTGDPSKWTDVLDAIRQAWASIWLFRTFEERSYNSIDHKAVVMALLVHHNFPDEEANGVAATANPYDPSGLQPGFYVNVQIGGDAEVVHPPPGVTSDQFIYQFTQPGMPTTYLSHSNLVADGQAVLTSAQIYELGQALDRIHTRFSAAYGPAAGNQGWYAMDVEFKFDGDKGQPAKLAVKQARPYPGRGQ
jgi:pyruvate,water dikinase